MATAPISTNAYFGIWVQDFHGSFESGRICQSCQGQDERRKIQSIELYGGLCVIVRPLHLVHVPCQQHARDIPILHEH